MSILAECGIWKKIPSTPGYIASSSGKIARIAKAKTRTTPYILRASMSGRRYALVKVTVHGHKHPRHIHHLVCEAFHGKRPKWAYCCCHNNGDPSDNRSCNLRWDTNAGNQADMVRHGTGRFGDRNGRAKLSWELVSEMRKEYNGKYGEYSRISRKYGIADSQVHEIIKKESWWPLP